MELDLATREDLLRIESKLDRLLGLLETPKTVNVSDICGFLKMNRSSVCYSHPWLLPNFGVSQYPGVRKWDVSVWEAWNARPVEERKREYIDREVGVIKREYRRVSPTRRTFVSKP